MNKDKTVLLVLGALAVLFASQVVLLVRWSMIDNPAVSQKGINISPSHSSDNAMLIDRAKSKTSILRELKSELVNGNVDLFAKPRKPKSETSAPVKKKPQEPSAMTKLLTDSKTRLLIWQQARDSLDKNYLPLFKTLKLDAEKEQKLRDYMADLNIAAADFQSVYAGQGGDNRDRAFAAATSEIFADIQGLVGPSQSKELLAYMTALPANEEFSVLKAELGLLEEISPEIEKNLSIIWSKSAMLPSASSGTAAAALMSLGKSIDVNEQQFLDDASKILSTRQMKLASDFLIHHRAPGSK